MVSSNCSMLGNALKTKFAKYLPRISMVTTGI